MKLIEQIKQYCSHLDGKYYQLVVWDDNNFDIIEPIYHGAIVYQFSQNEDGTVTINDGSRTYTITDIDDFHSYFPYIFE